jgi:hypothetical protein
MRGLWKLYPPDRMGIKTTESSSLIKLSRLAAFWLMRIMIFFSGKEDGKISLRATGFSKLISFTREPTMSAR